MFQLEPTSVNVFLMFPSDNVDILSQAADLRSLRLRLDNEELTNRDIIVRPNASPLHYDRLSMALLNGGMPLKSALERNFKPSGVSQADQTADARKVIISGQPVPISPLDKQLQVNLHYTGTGLKQLNLYKQVFRSIKV